MKEKEWKGDRREGVRRREQESTGEQVRNVLHGRFTTQPCTIGQSRCW